MSRVGKQPIALPDGVTAKIDAGTVSVNGPKGSLSFDIRQGVKVVQEDKNIVVSCGSNDRQAKANWGTTRAIINNMVQGVASGFSKTLELNGVGFTAKMSGNKITLAVGLSHDVDVEVPQGLNVKVAKQQIDIEGPDKHAVGQFAAKVRKIQPPEPYLGKGIRYKGENVRRKAGKTGK